MNKIKKYIKLLIKFIIYYKFNKKYIKLFIINYKFNKEFSLYFKNALLSKRITIWSSHIECFIKDEYINNYDSGCKFDFDKSLLNWSEIYEYKYTLNDPDLTVIVHTKQYIRNEKLKQLGIN